MTTIKSRILSIWDTANVSVRICCVKFAQRVVLAQTAATGNEPRVCHVHNTQKLASAIIQCQYN